VQFTHHDLALKGKKSIPEGIDGIGQVLVE
jgi:hypothetical protein